MHDFTKKLKTELSVRADEERKPKMEQYMRNKFDFYGVMASPRKEAFSIAWRDAKPNYNELSHIIKELWTDKREMQYCAIELCMKFKRHLQDDFDSQIEWMATHKSWWDTIDPLSSGVAGHFFQKYPERLDSVIQKWSISHDFWLRRVCIIFQLRYKEQTNKELLSALILDNIGSDEFFIQKAIGWALREYAKTNPRWVKEFCDSHDLKKLSRREALKHMK